MSMTITMHLAVRDQNYLALVAGAERASAGCSGDLLESVRNACKLHGDAFFVNEHHELDAIRAANRNRRVIIKVRRKREIHYLGES